ncbi:MAG: T9SS type A sorting domain-containing protein [Candidatus Eiseniibacteriota bacterium]|nr:MAG: T9SS type A sorting domain-containing protein [Candidatus Eisenbacteria bacterium]
MKRLKLVGTLACLISLALLPSGAPAGWQENGNPVCTASGNQLDLQVTSDGTGGAIITWVDYRGTDPDIYAQRVAASGDTLWMTSGVAICTATSTQFRPQITSDGAGGAFITWQDERSGDYNSHIYAQRVDASGSVLWTMDGVAICTADWEQEFPQIVSDGAGGAIITWQDYRSSVTSWDIYAQRVDASGNVLWIVDGEIICAAPSHQEDPQIASDGASGAIITWNDYRSGRWDIYVRRVSASGDTLWTGNGVPIVTRTGDQMQAQIISDGAGGAIITWEDLRVAMQADISAQRVDASGSVLWTPDGEDVCEALNDQRYPQLDSDGAGGAIITWEDYRSSVTSLDIYAQRVDASGNMLWTADGEPVCTAGNGQTYPEIVSDEAGGAIITWRDNRSGVTSWDIYAQRVDASGNTLWAGNGEAISTDPNSQYNPQIVSDGAGGTIVTWRDNRNGIVNWDIYVGRVDGNGPVVSVEEIPAPTEAYWMEQNFPNPFNPLTTIVFHIVKPAHVVIRICDIAGRPVRTLVEGWYEAQRYEIAWDGRDDEGRDVVSGVYLYQLETTGGAESKKMVLLR